MKSSLVIQELRERVLVLDEQFDRIRQEREAIRVVLDMYEREAGINSQNRERTHKEILTDTIEEVLMDAQKPLHRKDILTGVIDKGVYIGGEKPLNSLSSYLSTDQRFRVAGRGIWELKEWTNTPSNSDLMQTINQPLLKEQDSNDLRELEAASENESHLGGFAK